MAWAAAAVVPVGRNSYVRTCSHMHSSNRRPATGEPARRRRSKLKTITSGSWQPCGVRSLPLPLGRPCRLRRELWLRHLVGDRHHSPLRKFHRRYQAPPVSNPKHTTLMLPRRRRRQHPPTSAPVLVASGPTARRTHLFRWMSFAIRSPDCNG